MDKISLTLNPAQAHGQTAVKIGDRTFAENVPVEVDSLDEDLQRAVDSGLLHRNVAEPAPLPAAPAMPAAPVGGPGLTEHGLSKPTPRSGDEGQGDLPLSPETRGTKTRK